ncbi:MAG TPA: FtsQ-type POTRA domain-containing protein [Blastocatellia bacterium]|nr:FtsQ-type POTRA domain-containing protein [Blastocatellia bacterium]
MTPRKDSNIRGQNVANKRRRSERVRRTRGLSVGAVVSFVRRFAKQISIFLVLIALVIGYNVFAGSKLFDLKRVLVVGAAESLRPEIEQTVTRTVNAQKLLDVNLNQIREKVEAIPRVRTAWVVRTLPDTLRIEVEERQRAVLVRRHSSGALVWLDQDAIELGELSSFGPTEAASIPPIANGFSEGERSKAAVADDKDRITIYKQIERDLSSGPNPLWSLVDEVDLAFTKDVHLHLARPSVTVHVGSQDFRNRFQTALQILDAAGRGDVEMLRRFTVPDPESVIANRDRITFVDTARVKHIVVSYSGPSAEKAPRQETALAEAPKKK